MDIKCFTKDHDMKILIPQVSPDGSYYKGEESPGMLELENDPFMEASGPVQYDFFVQVVSHELIVNGSISVEIRLKCSKCTDFFSTTVADSSFLRAYTLSEGMEYVDMAEDIREDILLHIPGFPVCSEDCKGLCPQCGINRNVRSCQCQPPAFHENWSELDQLDLN